MLQNMIHQYVTIAGIGLILGGSLAGIVIILDYVITSVFSMMKGR